MKTDDIIKHSTDPSVIHARSSADSLRSDDGAGLMEKAAPRAHQPVARKPKLRNLTPEQAYELLATARTADHVELYLRDGRMIDGAILFNDIKGTGRIINVTKEISVDFRADNVRDIRF